MTEEEMWEFDAAHDAAMDEVALNDRVFEAVEHALARIIHLAVAAFARTWVVAATSAHILANVATTVCGVFP